MTASVLSLLSFSFPAAALTCSYPTFTQSSGMITSDNDHQWNQDEGKTSAYGNVPIDKTKGQWCMMFEMKATTSNDLVGNSYPYFTPMSTQGIVKVGDVYKNLKVLVDFDANTVTYYQGEKVLQTGNNQGQPIGQQFVVQLTNAGDYMRIINPNPEIVAPATVVPTPATVVPEINEFTCQLNGFWQNEILSGKCPDQPKCCGLFGSKQAKLPLFCKPTNAWCSTQAYTEGQFWSKMKKSCCESYGVSFSSLCSQAPAYQVGSLVPQSSIHDIISHGGSMVTSPAQCMQEQQAKATLLAKALAAQKAKADKGGIQSATYHQNFPKDVSFMQGGYCYHLHDCPTHMSLGLCNVGILMNNEIFGTCEQFGYSTEVANKSVIIAPKFQKFAKDPACPSVTMILLVI